MNFLAHVFLSGSNEQIMVGNFIGDFVKGKEHEMYAPDIQRGILLHRHIDAYTDQHPAVYQSKKRLWKKYHHYAAVIVDVFYDHFLAAGWSAYHNMTLQDFSRHVYETVLQYDEVLPDRVKYMLKFMMRDNWLYSYSRTEGIHQALTGMARRTSFKSGMENAVQDLIAEYETFKEDFELFFPDVQAYVTEWLRNN